MQVSLRVKVKFYLNDLRGNVMNKLELSGDFGGPFVQGAAGNEIIVGIASWGKIFD